MGKNRIPPQPIVTGFFPMPPVAANRAKFSRNIIFVKKACFSPIKLISLGLKKFNSWGFSEARLYPCIKC
jgi:hypothetical protein